MGSFTRSPRLCQPLGSVRNTHSTCQEESLGQVLISSRIGLGAQGGGELQKVCVLGEGGSEGVTPYGTPA